MRHSRARAVSEVIDDLLDVKRRAGLWRGKVGVLAWTKLSRGSWIGREERPLGHAGSPPGAVAAIVGIG